MKLMKYDKKRFNHAQLYGIQRQYKYFKFQKKLFHYKYITWTSWRSACSYCTIIKARIRILHDMSKRQKERGRLGTKHPVYTVNRLVTLYSSYKNRLGSHVSRLVKLYTLTDCRKLSYKEGGATYPSVIFDNTRLCVMSPTKTNEPFYNLVITSLKCDTQGKNNIWRYSSIGENTCTQSFVQRISCTSLLIDSRRQSLTTRRTNFESRTIGISTSLSGLSLSDS